MNAATHYRKAIALFPPLTRAEAKTLEKTRTTRLGETALDLIAKGEPALQELHRGAALTECDWRPAAGGGTESLIELLGKFRQLSQLGGLRARHALQQEDGRAAVADLTAIFMAARHVGRDGLLISLLVQISLELLAEDVAGAHLLQFNIPTLEMLAARLESLPPSATLADAMRREKEFAVRTVRPQFENKSGPETLALLRQGASRSFARATFKAGGGDGPGVQELIDATTALYDELGAILMQKGTLYTEAVADFEKRHGAGNPMMKLVLGHADGVRRGAARAATRFAMFEAAVALGLGGDWRPETVRNFFQGSPFACRFFRDGLELCAPHLPPGRPPRTLTVGKPRGLLAWARGSLGDFAPLFFRQA